MAESTAEDAPAPPRLVPVQMPPREPETASADPGPERVEAPPVEAAPSGPAVAEDPPTARVVASRPRPAGEPPDVPLPRMPGTNQLRAGTKWDPQRGAWVRTHAYEIPARRGQVVAFYRKALEDASLSVTEVDGAPDEEGAVPVYLKGRRTGEHAHVTVRQDVAELKTRVRVIWRVFVEEGA
ncbi:MAG: hypothetical protein AAGA54_18045 [Myxococcota bacterium]